MSGRRGGAGGEVESDRHWVQGFFAGAMKTRLNLDRGDGGTTLPRH